MEGRVSSRGHRFNVEHPARRLRAVNPERKGELNMRVGVAADHGGFELKRQLVEELAATGHDVVDFGAHRFDPADDFPDFVVPLARAVVERTVERGLAVCGSGVGASIAANKVPGARAALITDVYSARQGVEDDDMNMMCLGGRVVGVELARDLLRAFLKARYRPAERFERRLAKVAALEDESSRTTHGRTRNEE